ncbi:MAG TPA: DUF2723 domain-containing protein [Bacteroidia bacterium]|nr:DUF2723 domain-containing protein [Bacteroidia bacterium]
MSLVRRQNIYLCAVINATFRKQNNQIGWGVFLISTIVYIKCIEPTASFWDCGEYIACSYGLESGHPPGAPTFLLIAKFFSLFSFGHKELVAPLINSMSALASAFTILFLYWSITHIGRRIYLKTEADMNSDKKWMILLAGVIGALSYAFTDSFWFSAEEGEVYALSSLFTAVVFWAMLKWEDQADEPHSGRWIVLIAFLIGLSIGVHLLNLLAIPALVLIFYFRKAEKVVLWKFFVVLFSGVLLLGFVQGVLIPGVVSLAGKTELLFVNKFHMGFNSGTIAYFSIVILFLGAGIFISQWRKWPVINTVFLSLTVLLIGYSTFFVLVIRAQAGTPINEDCPSNAISMLSYLNREQYGDWPLLYGPYYNTPLDTATPYTDGEPIYVKDTISKRYIVSYSRKETESHYDSRGCTFFPRMYSSGHADAYKNWVTITGNPVQFSQPHGKMITEYIPTFNENLQFFTTYQCGWMYARYFAWNFIGKQNDHLGYGNDAEGNWLSGLPILDNIRLGDQSLLPKIEKNNKGRNRYFAIPLFLGICGFFWLLKFSRRYSLVVLLLFLGTGLAIVIYLNQTPWQPRERDYAYVGSFYAFCIWLGFGVMQIWIWMKKLLTGKNILIATTALSALSPVILFAQNLNDHDRSGRTVANDVAVNFLESCDKNAILFTYADNDTFPLWYAQEVLGIRRDVRIVCLSLLRSDWYIDQMKTKNYESDPLPISMTHWQYREGTRDYLNILAESLDTMDLNTVVKNFSSEKFSDKFVTTDNDTLNYIASPYLMLPVNQDAVYGKDNFYHVDHKDADDTIYFNLRGNYILKDQMIILDILANNNWKRPINFAVNMPVTSYAGLDQYLSLQGMTYKLTPVKNKREDESLLTRPMVNADKSYDIIMHTFRYGGLSNPSVLADETVQRMFSDPVRISCALTSTYLAENGQAKKAFDIIQKCVTEIPASQVAPDNY